MIRSILLGAKLALLPVAASACLVCIDVPDDSLADLAVAGDAVALLRPSPTDPFRYGPVAFLKGGPELPSVPFLVTRLAAALHALDPHAVTIGIYSKENGWSLHDHGSAALGKTLQAALAEVPSSPAERMAFFGPLVVHADPAVQQMALIEIAGLPYTFVRQAMARPTRREVARRAFDPLWSEWAPVMILLFGTSNNPEDAKFIREAVDRLAHSRRTTHLAAWATALIEVDGMSGLHTLQRRFAGGPEESAETVRALASALAEHAARRDVVGDAAAAVLADLGTARPEAAGVLARALMERADWSAAGRLARLEDDGRIVDPADAFAVRHYVATAADADAPVQ